ncbi:MAG: hypothetical protein WC683_00985 [bacterium]
MNEMRDTMSGDEIREMVDQAVVAYCAARGTTPDAEERRLLRDLQSRVTVAERFRIRQGARDLLELAALHNVEDPVGELLAAYRYLESPPVRRGEGAPAEWLAAGIRRALGLPEPLDALVEQEIAHAQEQLRERLAAYAHDAWSRWARAVLPDIEGAVRRHHPCCDCAACKRVLRWRGLLVPYADLPEEEKASDRKEADLILAILRGSNTEFFVCPDEDEGGDA